MRLIQYLSVRGSQVKGIIADASQIQLFASAGVRHRRVAAEGPADEEAHKAQGNPIDIGMASAKAEGIQIDYTPGRSGAPSRGYHYCYPI